MISRNFVTLKIYVMVNIKLYKSRTCKTFAFTSLDGQYRPLYKSYSNFFDISCHLPDIKLYSIARNWVTLSI